MELTVYNRNGDKTDKTVSLNPDIYNITPNDHAIYLAVKQYMANQRQGTHSSTEKSSHSGSTRKLKKQKGSGAARYGSIKSPLFRGGARVFGPRPRDYSFKLNKKLKDLARKSALSYKATNSEIFVLENFTMEKPKTKEVINILTKLNVLGKKTLIVVNENSANIYLSARNIPKMRIINATDINTYEILRANNLLILEDSISKIDNLLISN